MDIVVGRREGGRRWRREKGAQKMGESLSQDSGRKQGGSAVEAVPHFSFFGKVHAAQGTERTEFTILSCEGRIMGLTPCPSLALPWTSASERRSARPAAGHFFERTQKFYLGGHLSSLALALLLSFCAYRRSDILTGCETTITTAATIASNRSRTNH